MPDTVLGFGDMAGRKRHPALLPVGHIPWEIQKSEQLQTNSNKERVREDFLEEAAHKLGCEGVEGWLSFWGGLGVEWGRVLQAERKAWAKAQKVRKNMGLPRVLSPSSCLEKTPVPRTLSSSALSPPFL